MIIIVSLLLAPLMAINLVFLAEVLLGLCRRIFFSSASTNSGATIIVPAHDEANIIEQTLRGLLAVISEAYPVLVVADNCSDGTAAIARRLGVYVIERHDKQRRGKGYALAYAREWLRADPPPAVLVLDADCRTDSQSIRNLAESCARTHTSWQAINLLEPSLIAPPMVQISTFAFLIKNLVRQRGLQRLTGGVHLTGTGMCLPWHQFDQADLASPSIVEDIRLGIELTGQGMRPQLAENSFVWSAHAELGTSLAQRSRWEGGFLAMARSHAPRIMFQAVKDLAPRKFLIGLDMLVPPLAMLAIINTGAVLITGGLALVEAISWGPTVILSVVTVSACAVLFLAWLREGQECVNAKSLLRLPIYAIWKIPMYIGLLKGGPPAKWRRTERPPGKDL